MQKQISDVKKAPTANRSRNAKRALERKAKRKEKADASQHQASTNKSPQSLDKHSPQPNMSPSTARNTHIQQIAKSHASQQPDESSRAPTASAALSNIHSFQWTLLDEKSQLAAYQGLHDNVHDLDLLLKCQYRTEPYMKIADFERHSKCTRCLRKHKDIKNKKYCSYHPNPVLIQDDQGRKFHTCCGQLEACKTDYGHRWEEMTPKFEGRYASFVETPASNNAYTKSKAIVIDCEMVGVSDGFSELARICAVDYLTGEILLYCFVDPVERVIDYRTRYSGISKDKIARAKVTGNCLAHWSAARNALLQFIDANTIVIGHSLRNDLNVLRLVHTTVVDSELICKARIGVGFGLKNLCKEILNLNIQKGKEGHDPYEDCMATREAVLWMTCTNKIKFEEWASVKRKEEDERKAKVQREHEERKKKKADSDILKELDEILIIEDRAGPKH